MVTNSKCIQSKTPCNNKSLNGMVWKKCPKDVYVGKYSLEMGVSSAVICFNESRNGILDNFASLLNYLSLKEITTVYG